MTAITYYSDPVDSTNYGVLFAEQPQREFSFGSEETYTRVFKAICPIAPGTSEHYGPPVIGNELRRQFGIERGALYVLPSGETSNVARCTDIKGRQAPEEGQNVYFVTVEYGLTTWGGGDNPLLAPITYGWTSEFVELPLWFDYDPAGAKPVLNSAGDPFEDPLHDGYSRRVLTVRRNEASHAALTSALYENKCNSDTWNTLPPYTVLCRSISPEHVDYQGIAGGYDVVTYQFVFDFVFGFITKRADVGWQTFDGTDKKRIFYEGGWEPSEIPFLNGSGGLLAAGADPEIIDFYEKDVIAFNTIFPWVVL